MRAKPPTAPPPPPPHQELGGKLRRKIFAFANIIALLFVIGGVTTANAQTPSVMLTKAEWRADNSGIDLEWEWENFDPDINYILSTCVFITCTPSTTIRIFSSTSSAPTSTRDHTSATSHLDRRIGGNNNPSTTTTRSYQIRPITDGAFSASNVVVVLSLSPRPLIVLAAVAEVATENSLRLDWTGGNGIPFICIDSTPADVGSTTIQGCKGRRALTLVPNRVVPSGFPLPSAAIPGTRNVITPLFIPGATLYFQVGDERLHRLSAVVAYTLPGGEPELGDTDTDTVMHKNILRQIPAGIHRGIYDRIYQRQRADGKWK